MPVFDFHCQECGEVYEGLVRRTADTAPPCPTCGAAEAKRLFSAPAVSTENTRAQSLRSSHQRERARGVERVEEQRRYEREHDGH